MKFLVGEEGSRVLRKFLSTHSDMKLAVAYLGEHATSFIDKSVGRNTKVICDLDSGACNPTAVRKLRGRLQLRSHSDLHAKVYLSAEKAIVGSANLSSNGIGLTDGIRAGLVEANVEINEPNVVSQIHSWFDILWDGAREISDEDLAYAAEAWNRRKKLTGSLRPPPRSKRVPESLFQAVKANPSRFQNVWVIFTWSDRSELGQQKHEEIVTEAATHGEYIDSYDEWPGLPKGAWLIDLHCESRKATDVGYSGVWWAPEATLFASYGSGKTQGRLTVVYRSTIPDGVEIDGHIYRMTKKEISFLKKNAQKIITASKPKKGDTGSLLQVEALFDLETTKAGRS
jgi:hypothetical protein